MNKVLYRLTIILIASSLILNWIVAPTYEDRGLMNLNLLPKQAIIIVELIQLIFWCYLILTGKSKIVSATLFTLGVILVELIVLQTHHGHLSNLIFGIRNYFFWIPTFYLGVVFRQNPDQLKKLLKIVLYIMIFQVPLTIWQYLHIKTIKYSGTIYDLISGTMGGQATNLLGMLIVGTTIFLLNYYMINKNRKYLMLSLILMIPIALSETKGAFLLIFFAFFIITLQYSKSLKNVFQLMVGMSIILVTFYFIYINFISYSRDIISLDYYLGYDRSAGLFGEKLSRVESLLNSFNTIINNNSLLLGTGIGNASINHFGADGYYYDFYKIRHQLATIVLETGLLGTIVYHSFLIFAIVKLSKIRRFTSSFDKIIIRSTITITIMLILSGLWSNIIFRTQFSILYSILLGYSLNIKNNEITYSVPG